jgi:predicted membrane protein
LPSVMRVLLWIVFFMGLFLIAKVFFLFFLPILLLVLVANLIYRKYIHKGPRPTGSSFNFFSNRVYPRYSSKANKQEYTTVIDADNMEKEYKIPKI